ncbi:hypothetical protein VTL71DRAFT_7459 [Oculimacula yallundae]|uniref:NACHT domain-containing protein n=1 Tax=Oculimacula yallundae TaxID=86028 RepID=A0ABR4BVQ0_9HELO
MSGLEIIGLAASLASIADATKKIYVFVEDVYKADEQRREILQQLRCLEDISETMEWIKQRLSEDEWEKRLDLSKPTNPAYGLKVALDKIEDLAHIDANNLRVWRTWGKVKWHYKKKKLEPLFLEVHRYGTNFIPILIRAQTKILSKDGSSTRTMMKQIEEDRKKDEEANKLLLLTNEEDRKKREEAGVTKMTTLVKEVEDLGVIAKARQIEEAKEYQKKVEKWLSILEFQSRQEAILAKVKREQGSSIGRWFIESDAFKVWRDGKLGVLKGLGEPGAGKTVLSSLIVDELQKQSPLTPVLYIFLEKAESHRQTPEALRGSLLKQLIQFNEAGLNTAIRDAFEKAFKRGASPDENITRALLKAEVQAYSHVFVIVDGLDEASDDSRDFVEEDLEGLDPEKIKILTMSRINTVESLRERFCNGCGTTCIRYHKCVDCFESQCDMCKNEGFDNIFFCISCYDGGKRCLHGTSHEMEETTDTKYEVEISTPDEEIERFVHASILADMPKPASETSTGRNVGKNELARSCAKLPALFEEVQTFVTQKAAGRFLLAREYVKSFKKKYSLADIRRMLRTEGSGELAPLYAEDIAWIVEKQDIGPLARRVLSVVYHAKRNLTLLELQQALATNDGDTGHDPEAIIHEDTIINATNGLIRIERLLSDDQDVDVIVRFDHLTRREYFDSSWQLWFSSGQVDIANTCLTFMNFEEFAKRFPSEELFKAREKDLPFISYAVQFWGDHVRDIGLKSTEIVEKAVTYLKDPSRVRAYIQAAWAANTRHKDKWDVRSSIHPLHICGWFGLEHLIPALGYSVADIDIKEMTHHQTPLMYACRRGNIETVKTFLELGANVNKQSQKGRTPLFEAILRLQNSLISQDPGKGSKVQKKGFNSKADIEKSERIVKLLLSAGTGVNKVNLDIQNPELRQRTVLITSIAYKQVSIALDILSHTDLDVNIADSEGTTALCLSACLGMTDVVARLLQFPSINIDQADKDGHQTALLFASRSSPTPDVVELLLSKGADPNKPDAHGKAPIFMSLQASNPDIFEAFETVSEIDLHCTDGDGRSLLHWAAEFGNLSAINKLEAKKLSIESQDKLGTRPLHDACRHGNAEAADMLLKFGADQSAKDKLGRTPVVVALQYGHEDLVNICKVHGEELLLIDLPAWSLATTRQLDAIARLISTEPLCLNIREPRTECSALHCVLVENDMEESTVQTEILRTLLSDGKMDPDEPDRYGQTPLHYAAIYGNYEATRVLLEHKARPDVLDNFGFTPLLIAHKNQYTNQNLAVAIALIEEDVTIDESRLNLDDLLLAALKLESSTAVSYLIKAGASRMATDADGRTADIIAENSKNKDLIKALRDFTSRRVKPPMRAMSSKCVIPQLRDVNEEATEILDLIKHNKVTFNDTATSELDTRPIFARSVHIGQDVEYEAAEDIEAKMMPYSVPRARGEDEVKKMLGDMSLSIPSTFRDRNLMAERLQAV